MVDEKKQALGRALYKSMVPKDIPQGIRLHFMRDIYP